jgi:hypothetical protein
MQLIAVSTGGYGRDFTFKWELLSISALNLTQNASHAITKNQLDTHLSQATTNILELQATLTPVDYSYTFGISATNW